MKDPSRGKLSGEGEGNGISQNHSGLGLRAIAQRDHLDLALCSCENDRSPNDETEEQAEGTAIS